MDGKQDSGLQRFKARFNITRAEASVLMMGTGKSYEDLQPAIRKPSEPYSFIPPGLVLKMLMKSCSF